MITLHRLNGQSFVLNALHIVSVESTHDTVLTLLNGEKLLVEETAEQVTERCRDFLQSIGRVVATTAVGLP